MGVLEKQNDPSAAFNDPSAAFNDPNNNPKNKAKTIDNLNKSRTEALNDTKTPTYIDTNRLIKLTRHS